MQYSWGEPRVAFTNFSSTPDRRGRALICRRGTFPGFSSDDFRETVDPPRCLRGPGDDSRSTRDPTPPPCLRTRGKPRRKRGGGRAPCRKKSQPLRGSAPMNHTARVSAVDRIKNLGRKNPYETVDPDESSVSLPLLSLRKAPASFFLFFSSLLLLRQTQTTRT